MYSHILAGTNVHHQGVCVSNLYGYESRFGNNPQFHRNPWLELGICIGLSAKSNLHLDVHADVCVGFCKDRSIKITYAIVQLWRHKTIRDDHI